MPNFDKDGNLIVELDDPNANKDIFTHEDKEYILNGEGNALNDDGSVFKNKEEIAEIKKAIEDAKLKEDPTETVIKIGEVEYKLNEAGDAVDADGKVYKTKVELEALELEEGEEIKVGEDTFTLKNGDAIDKDGKVVYTADQLKEMEEISDKVVEFDIDEIQKLSNITPLKEDGTPVIYDKTQEGVAAYIKDVHKAAELQHRNDGLEEAIQTYPELTNVLNFMKTNNGSLEGFNSGMDYSKITLDESNEEQLVNVIIESKKAKGDSTDMITGFINYAKDSKKLFEYAKEELNYLTTKKADRDKLLAKSVEDKEIAQQKEFDNYWGVSFINDKKIELNNDDSVYNKLVKSGEITVNGKTYNIPENISVTLDGKTNVYTREQLFNYAYVPQPVPIQGKTVQLTGYELDKYMENQSKKIDDDILDIYTTFTKQDVNQLVEKTIQSRNITDLKKKIVKRYKVVTPSINEPSKKEELILPVH